MRWRVSWMDENHERHVQLCHYSTEATLLVAEIAEKDPKAMITLETLMDHANKYESPREAAR